MRDPEGVADALRAADSICICGHVNPDGDTIGSMLAMRLALQSMGKRVRVFLQDKVPDNLMFLPGAEEIRYPRENGEEYDLFLSVDVSDVRRLGDCAALRACCARTAQIDHHGTNSGFAGINSVDGNASATCTMIREQLRILNVPLTREIAECLYIGISTDTGNFSFDCTDPEAFRVMGDLMETGFPLAELSMKMFRERDKPQLRLLGRAIGNMSFVSQGRIAVMTLTKQDFEECGAMAEHADTLVNFGLETVGTQMAVLARESDDGRIKFSLRARAPLTVDDVASSLGGGGHARAAGISMEGNLEAATRQVVQAMIRRIEK
ncbi:MAG: DHH family phosphoesterase [Clostridiales bacterium]|nr:DHH family phosphoesterase [Clostridiales bacterium]